MPTVLMADLQPGSVLSRPVYSPRGILLASAGTVVSETHLAIFNSWGVLEATIAGTDEAVGLLDEAAGDAPRPLDEARVQEVQQLVEDRFALVVPLSPFMREVQRVTELLLIRRLEQGDSGE